MQIVCLRALINSDPCLWKTWKNRLRLDCDLGHVGEGSERTMHLRSRKAAEKHQHQQRQQQAPPPTPTPPCSGFWPHLLCLTVASCPRAWARDPAHAKPQPPSRHHRTLVVGSPTHALAARRQASLAAASAAVLWWRWTAIHVTPLPQHAIRTNASSRTPCMWGRRSRPTSAQ
jgi:hypothetical protein